MSGCGRSASGPAFPPKEKAAKTAAKKLGWTLNPEGTKSEEKDRVLYSFHAGDLEVAVVSCGIAEGNRYLAEIYSAMCLPEKPEFSWEDYQDVVTMAEILYGGFAEGELYEALSQSTPGLPTEGTEAAPDGKSHIWEVELPAGYGIVRWYVMPGTVEKNSPDSSFPVVRNWEANLTVTLFESKEAFESLAAASE